MDTYTVNCLEDLAQIIASDDDIKQYIAELPGMTYQFARYSDWIKPYLENQLRNSLNTANSTYYQNIRETSQRVLDLYKSYESYLMKVDTLESVNPEVLSCVPKQFVILRQTPNESYLDSFYEKDGVNLSLSFVECQYVWSQPTGKSNLSIGQKFLQKYTTSTNANVKVTPLNKSAAAMLKERDQ